MGRLMIIQLVFLMTLSQAAWGQAAPSVKDSINSHSQGSSVTEIRSLLDSSLVLKSSDVAGAIKVALHALELSESAGETTLVLNTCIHLGTLFFYAGLYENAVELYSRAYNLALKTGDLKKQLTIQTNLLSIKLVGKSSYDSVLHREMESTLAATRKLWQETNDTLLIKSNISNLLSNLSLLLMEDTNYQNLAEKYIKQSIEITENYSSPLYEVLRRKAVYAALLQKMGRFEESFELISNVAEESATNGFIPLEALAHHYMGGLFEELGKNKQAIEEYLLALEVVEDKNQSQIKESATALSRLYEAEGESANALKYTRLSETAINRINKDKAIEELARLELKRELDALETTLQEKNSLNVVRLLSLSGISILIAAVVFALFLSGRRKQKIDKLEKIKATLDAQKLQLENQLLAARIDEKDKQLASELVYKLSRNQIIDAAVKKLLEHNRIAKYRNKLIEDVVSELRESKNKQDAWLEFDILFQEVHQSFYNNLNTAFPKLTTNERRLAAMIRMNLTNREISALTGQSGRAIEMARIRLRKKLELTNTDIKLIEFLTSL